jgi:hypothetical protein
MGEAIWITADLDPANHIVEYYRVEPGYLLAHIVVQCHEVEPARTRVVVSYSYVGLTETANQDIAAMSQDAYREKLENWSQWIENYLSRSGREPKA